MHMLSAPGGRFVDFKELEAVDDVEAVRLVEAEADGRPCELWCGKRKVQTFAPA
jgi:hypothetical protein